MNILKKNSNSEVIFGTHICKGQIECEQFSTQILSTDISTLANNNNLVNEYPFISDFVDARLRNQFNECLKNNFGATLDQFPTSYFKAWLIFPISERGVVPYHLHNNATLSGVYYPIAESFSGGDLVFVDPRTNACRGYPEELKSHFANKHEKPTTGKYVIFPSYLPHYVEPYNDGKRICLAVDLHLRKT
jgi:Putative 2OG-Fe(II) oxygenase